MADARGVDMEESVVLTVCAGVDASRGYWEIDDELAHGCGVSAGVD